VLFEKSVQYIVFELTVGIIHYRVSNVPPSFSNISFQNFQGIFDRYSEVSNYVPYIMGEIKRRGMNLEVHVEFIDKIHELSL
jgi:hypothetical protein